VSRKRIHEIFDIPGGIFVRVRMSESKAETCLLSFYRDMHACMYVPSCRQKRAETVVYERYLTVMVWHEEKDN